MGPALSLRARLDASAPGTRRGVRRAAAVLGAAAGALALLPLLAAVPPVSAPALEAASDTALTCAALAAACLTHGRFLQSGRARDLWAVGAAATLGLTDLGDRILPTLASLGTESSRTALELWGQLVLAGMFAATAFASAPRPSAHPHRLMRAAIGASFIATLLTAVAGLTLGPAVPAGDGGALRSQPLATALCLLAIALFGSAGLRLAAHRDDAGDGSAALLAAAGGLLATAALYRLLDGATAAGVLRATQLPDAAAVVLVLLAALRHGPHARARLADAAARAERRRVARDLHDGLAQDLALIAAHGPALSRELGDDHPLVLAARRALTTARSAIGELSDPAGATAAQSLEAVAQELREELDVAIAVSAASDVDVAPRAREHITRIAREAIANAVRHGGARNVTVSLGRLERAVVLRVVDDGSGIGDLGDEIAEGFGLTSMRERAAALGGFLTVHASPRGGTELEVVFR